MTERQIHHFAEAESTSRHTAAFRQAVPGRRDEHGIRQSFRDRLVQRNQQGKQTDSEIQTQNQKAVAYLAENHQSYLLRVAQYLSRDPNDAEDIVQNVYIAMLSGRTQLSDPTEIDPVRYARVALRYAFHAYIRKEKVVGEERKERTISLDVVGVNISQLAEDGKQQLMAETNEVLAAAHQVAENSSNPQEFEENFLERYMYDYTYAEIAQMHNLSINTVMSRVGRMTKKIKTIMGVTEESLTESQDVLPARETVFSEELAKSG